MGHVLRDAVRSLKLLLREKTFSGTVLLTLALCLGANVAIYGVVHTVLLEPLPFPDPDRLVTVSNAYPGAGVPRASNGTVDFFQRRENVAAFEQVAVYQGGRSTVGEAGSAEAAASLRVSASFFPLLGVEPALGRTFLEEEMEEGSHEKVVLTHTAWQDYFGGAADVVGRELRLNGRPFTVVGVLQPDFLLPGSPDARLFVPTVFSQEDRELGNWHSNNFEMLARLVPGATVEQAAAQNLALNEALIDQWPVPNARGILQDAGFRTIVVPTAGDLVRDVEPVLYMLWAGVTLVLLIGCVNIANLTLARAHSRFMEVATRLALGASRARVAGHVVTEALVLGLIGGVLGLGVGALGLRLLETLGAGELPRGTEISIDLPVLGFALVASLGTALLFSAIPVTSVLRADLSPAFRAGGRTGTASRRSVLIRNGLVTGQVALAFVMLIGAGLMLVSFRAAVAVDPGFDPEDLLTGGIALPASRYADVEARRQFWDELLSEVRAVPEVTAAAVTSQLPFSGGGAANVIIPEGYVPQPGESLLAPATSIVSPGYFETLGIELVRGRDFAESDGPDATRVIVIDEWLANRYWPDADPLGSRMIFGGVPGADSVPEENLYTIVGVVATVKQNDLTAPDAEHVGAYYLAQRQIPTAAVSLATRSGTGSPADLTPAVRAILGRLDPELPFFGVQTMNERIDDSLLQRRVPLVLLGVFAAVALFLAVVGIYGALGYAVAQRTREIGIRMAMGSAPDRIFRSVVAQGMGVTAFGLLLGLGATYAATRLMEALLFGVAPTDLRVIGAVALTLTLVAVVASAAPARRATRVDPVESLAG